MAAEPGAHPPMQVPLDRVLWRYSGAAALVLGGLVLSGLLESGRESFIGAVLVALLGFLGVGVLLFNFACEGLGAMQGRLNLEQPVHFKPRWVGVAHGMVAFWLVLSAEHLLAERLSAPTAESVNVLRTACPTFKGQGPHSSAYPKVVDKNGNACFVLEEPALYFQGGYPTFSVPPSEWGANVALGERAKAWLLRYDSPLFGPRAYHRLSLVASPDTRR